MLHLDQCNNLVDIWKMLQRTLARKNRLRYSRLGERTFQNLANQQTPDPSPWVRWTSMRTCLQAEEFPTHRLLHSWPSNLLSWQQHGQRKGFADAQKKGQLPSSFNPVWLRYLRTTTRSTYESRAWARYHHDRSHHDSRKSQPAKDEVSQDIDQSLSKASSHKSSQSKKFSGNTRHNNIETVS